MCIRDRGKDVLEANENWDSQSVTYQEAKDEFRAFIETAEVFVTTVSEPGPPSEFANLVTSHEELKTLVNLVSADTIELLAGLESSDTGEQRAAALDSFNKNLDQFIKKIIFCSLQTLTDPLTRITYSPILVLLVDPRYFYSELL